MAHLYDVVVSNGTIDRILRRPIEAESGRHALSLGKLHCMAEEEPVRAIKLPSSQRVPHY